MKRKFLSAVLLLGAAVVVSCNDNGAGDGNGDTTSMTTTTITTDTASGISGSGAGSTTYAATPLQGQDTTFAKEAASAGLMEVELGNLAQQNAESPRVKSFGEMMVRDHSAANNELKSLASAKNLMLSDSMMKKHRDHIESLRKLTGKNFDRRYMQMMVDDHTEDVEKFEKASTNSTDADLKTWAGKTLPILRMHLDSAKAISNAKM